MNKKRLLGVWVVVVFLFLSNFAFAKSKESDDVEKGSLGDESWTVKNRFDGIFYYTHGTVVWGHEFGFYKMNDCKGDILWITYTASDEKIQNFDGKEAVISLDVDGKNFRIKSKLNCMGGLGFTQFMFFYDSIAEPVLIDALIKGRYVDIKILEPKELEDLLDIKGDRFGLKGFTASRKEAGKVCKDKSKN